MRRLPTASVEDVLSWRPCCDWDEKRIRTWWKKLKLPERVTAVLLLSHGVNRKAGGRSIRDDLSWAAHHLLPQNLEIHDPLDWEVMTYGKDIYECLPLGTRSSFHDKKMLRLLREWVEGENV